MVKSSSCSKKIKEFGYIYIYIYFTCVLFNYMSQCLFLTSHIKYTSQIYGVQYDIPDDFIAAFVCKWCKIK